MAKNGLLKGCETTPLQ